jgi:hypothetical protein
LVLGGATLGFCQAFRQRPENAQSPPVNLNQASPAVTQEIPKVSNESPARSGFVTHLDLAEAMDRLSARTFREMDNRFQAQDQAISALHELTAQTGSMIERLLQRLDALEDDDEEMVSPPPPSQKTAVLNI